MVSVLGACLANERFVRENCDSILIQEGQTVCRTFPTLEPTEPVKVKRHEAVKTEGKGEGQGAKTPKIRLGHEYDLDSRMRVTCTQRTSRRQQQSSQHLRNDGIRLILNGMVYVFAFTLTYEYYSHLGCFSVFFALSVLPQKSFRITLTWVKRMP